MVIEAITSDRSLYLEIFPVRQYNQRTAHGYNTGRFYKQGRNLISTLSIPFKNVNFAKTPSSLVTKQFSGDYITVMMIGGVLIIVIIVVDEGVFSSIEDI